MLLVFGESATIKRGAYFWTPDVDQLASFTKNHT